MALQHHHKNHQRTFLNWPRYFQNTTRGMIYKHKILAICVNIRHYLKESQLFQKIKILEKLIKCKVEINFFECFRILNQCPNLSIRTHSLFFVRGIQKFLSFCLFSKCKTSALSPPLLCLKRKIKSKSLKNNFPFIRVTGTLRSLGN